MLTHRHDNRFSLNFVEERSATRKKSSRKKALVLKFTRIAELMVSEQLPVRISHNFRPHTFLFDFTLLDPFFLIFRAIFEQWSETRGNDAIE